MSMNGSVFRPRRIFEVVDLLVLSPSASTIHQEYLILVPDLASANSTTQ